MPDTNQSIPAWVDVDKLFDADDRQRIVECVAAIRPITAAIAAFVNEWGGLVREVHYKWGEIANVDTDEMVEAVMDTVGASAIFEFVGELEDGMKDLRKVRVFTSDEVRDLAPDDSDG